MFDVKYVKHRSHSSKYCPDEEENFPNLCINGEILLKESLKRAPNDVFTKLCVYSRLTLNYLSLT